MKSTMTEVEFREAVKRSVERQQGSPTAAWSYTQAAVDAAREAGLEFAPVKLPERLAIREDLAPSQESPAPIICVEYPATALSRGMPPTQPWWPATTPTQG